MLRYPIKLEPDDNGTFLVTAPDFPELTTFGETREEAIAYAVDALEEVIAMRMSLREDMPKPSNGKVRAALPTQTAMKVALYQAMREKGITKYRLAKLLNWHMPQVDRLLNLNHASQIRQFDDAFNALGMRLRIEAHDEKAAKAA